MSSLLVSILESFLGDCRKNNEDTGQVAFDCPECSAEKGMYDGDGKGNLEVNYNLGKYKCWSCYETNHMHGPVMKLLKKYATPKNIRDYLLIKPDADIVIDRQRMNVEVHLPEGYKKLSECTSRDYKAGQALAYLRKRGITDKIIKDFSIGYTFKGKYFNRIIIPSYDSEEKLNYFIARWFDKEYTKLKYLNPEAEKQEIIFNEWLINLDATIYLVEGVFESLIIPNSIPLLGKFISQQLLELLHDRAKGLVIVVLDGDAYSDGEKLYNQLNFGELRDRIRIVKTPEEYDPSLIYQKLGVKGIIKLLKSAKKIDFSF